MNIVTKRHITEIAAYGALMLSAVLLFWNDSLQGAEWTYPYFSGAQHLDSQLNWRYSLSGFDAFHSMSLEQQRNYDFSKEPANDLLGYSYHGAGYVGLIWLANHLIPLASSIHSIVWLQIIFHIGSTLLVAFLLGRGVYRGLFILLYGVNPVVIHFVTYPFYYYWQVIPSVLLTAYLLRSVRVGKWTYLLMLILLLSFVVRPSTLLVSIFILSLIFYKERHRHAFVAAMVFLVAVGILRTPSSVWHTAYVGLGAYENAQGIELIDDAGYKRFKQVTGKELTTALPQGSFYDPIIRKEYYDVMKSEYLSVVRESPVTILSNVARNVLQAFSIGYLVKYPSLRSWVMITGAIVIALMCWARLYVLGWAILLSSAGFILYYPPIPAYMFGSYLILSVAAIDILRKLHERPWRR